ncbi:rhomboid protease GluP [Mucilaginibacter pineti]|uniref:Rhomboid protease GluP n=1 Tax=Mucilaginibacter pineti TaxID=1391627 RepID=A0A1G6TF83_9SPHI|nr:rhomboid family intramembrane serine protease [Mucilaginibacter pineti]SDD27721.1 rhomboid protease GluP [Mucilaginibacter pineti]
MAAGFIPKYIEEYPLINLSTDDFLVIADEAVKRLDWKISFISETGIIAYKPMQIFSPGAEIRITIDNEKATLKSSSTGSEMVDMGRNKKLVLALIDILDEIKTTISTEELTSKYQIIKDNLVPDEDDILKLPPPTVSDQIAGFFSFFKPTKTYFITPILVNLNILIFILMVIKGVSFIEPDSQSLLNWGANFRPLTLDGQWWRLITNTFLHIGIIHLLLNMYALIYIGLLLEPYLGKLKFLSAYLLTGIAASVTSLWWHDLTISAGASGAIFGMYGVFLAMLTTDLIEKTARRAFLTSIGIFVAYNLINGVKGNIDNAAHIGGLLSGLIIGYSFTVSLKKPGDNGLSYAIIGSLTVITIIGSAMTFKNISNDLPIYQADMKRFSDIESMALEIYNLPKDTPKDKLLDEIKNRGIYYWNEDLELVKKDEKLKIPKPLLAQTGKLKEYCNLRLKCYQLIYKAIDEDTDKYKEQIETYNKQIQSIIDELKRVNSQ